MGRVDDVSISGRPRCAGEWEKVERSGATTLYSRVIEFLRLGVGEA